MGGAATHPQQLIQHQRRRNPFAKGSLVEVRTKEEDFKGVFFSATVILSKNLSPRKGNRKNLKKLYVEYHDLLAYENGSDRLREYVDVSCVRPAQPFQEIVKGLEPGEAVDAFYKDGWWTGVVTRVVEGGERFVVTFEHPPDELEFGLADLRVHWDWVNGRWVRPVNKSTAGLMFDVGRKVEVSFDEEDRKDAWFPATIDKDVGNGAFLVECGSENNDNQAQSVKVTVDSRHMRPCPPLLKDKNFVLLEKVDAYFDWGWWSGTITKQLENSRYVVFFKQMKRDKEFDQSELRPHLEWKDGKWFASTQLSQEVPIVSSNDGTNEHHTDENLSASMAIVPVDNSGDGKDNSDGNLTSSLTSMKGHFDQLTPDNRDSSHVTTSLTKRRQHLSYSRNALSQPLKKLKEGNVVGANQEDTQDRPIKELLSGSVSPVSVNNGATSATQTATGEQSTDNPSWGKRNPRKRRSIDGIRNVGEKINTASSSMKKSITDVLLLGSPEADVGGKEPDAVRNTAEDIQNEHSKEETELPIIIGLPCAGMGVKRVRRSDNKETRNIGNEQKQQLNDSTIQKTEDGKQLELVEFSQKRKRGRPRKVPVQSIQNPVRGNAQRVVSSDDLNKNEDTHGTPDVNVMGIEAATPNQGMVAFSKGKLTNAQSDPEDRQGSTVKRAIAKMHDKKVVRESIRLRENPSLKRGRWQITGEKIDLRVQGSRDASRGKTTEVNRTVDVENVDAEASNNGLDDEPLSKWIEEMNSPSLIDGSRLSPVSTVEQSTGNGEKLRGVIVLEEESEKQPESRTKACSSVDKVPIVPSEQQTLPFMKNTVLWKTVESMEVFQRIPQKPHFQPLEHFKESSREGLAIGYMVTFSILVEKTSQLQLDDPKSKADEILETLADLERHGFDVRVVRDRVIEFLAVKNKQEKLVDKTNELNSRISEHNQVKNRIEEEIREINEEIKKLQEKLLLAESAKEKEDVEIESSCAELKETEESIKSMQLDFSGTYSWLS